MLNSFFLFLNAYFRAGQILEGTVSIVFILKSIRWL